MRDLFTLLTHLFATLFRLAQPGGVRTVIAESVLVKHQLLILNRSPATRAQSANLGSPDCQLLFTLDPADSAI